MPYYSDTWTDKELEALERRITEVFKQAEKDLDKEVKEYFAKFELRDKEMKALVDAGEMSKDEYQRWRKTQIGRGQRFEALRDKMAERYTQANEVANAYVNDMTPSIYSLNRNYEAYIIEKAVGSCDFTMWDEATVRRLLAEHPDLMPYYPAQRALDRGIDLAYGKDQITKHVTSGILRGLPPGKIANELMASITGMSRDSAVRAARTGITAAQNAGRMDSYVAAEKMGIQIKRRWICTKDARTRLSHGLADGQIVEGTKKPFTVGGYKMMFPGDKSLGAPGYEIYNCRCTTRTVEKDGIEAEPRQMRVRNPKTDEWELVNEMTYSEWLDWKKTGKKPIAKTGNGAKIKVDKPSPDAKKKKVGGVDCWVHSVGEFGFTDGTSGGIKKTVPATIYTTPDGTQFIYPKRYNKKNQTLTPDDAIATWCRVPENIRTKIQKTVEIVDYYNPQDSYWRKTYKNFTHSYAIGGDKITIFRSDYHSLDYLAHTYCHEGGHYIDYNLPGTSKGDRYCNQADWQAAIAKDLETSGKKSWRAYGENSALEDFADSVGYYTLMHDEFVKTFPERSKLLAEILK